MGITGPWEVLDAVHEEKSFLEHTIIEGFQQNHQSNHTFIIGVNVSIYASCEAVFKNPALRAQAGKNPELQILFFKLFHYLRSPVTLVFIFDGPH
ncbi:hypothetical protein L208DRAFT_1256361 [Tricholoma matsutake]|nr:hypothetical protein L208DRAFT_1256361 [Tricholoma matsutake 945]